MIRVTRRFGPHTAVSGGLFSTLCYLLFVWPIVITLKISFLLVWALFAGIGLLARALITLVDRLDRAHR